MDSKKEAKPEDQESSLENAEYIGNIWGWKFSLISLAVMSVLILWIAIRSCTATPDNQKVIDPTENING